MKKLNNIQNFINVLFIIIILCQGFTIKNISNNIDMINDNIDILDSNIEILDNENIFLYSKLFEHREKFYYIEPRFEQMRKISIWNYLTLQYYFKDSSDEVKKLYHIEDID